MKRIVCLGLILAGAGSLAVAQVSPEEHAAHHPEQAAPTATAPKAAAPSESKPGAQMQQKMTSMQELMDKIEKTEDPAERARLLEQHRKAMQELLGSMKQMECGMGTAGMMGGDAKKGASGDSQMSQGMMSQGMMQCHQMMQTRMDMMVGMMEQMMRHQAAQDPMHSGKK